MSGHPQFFRIAVEAEVRSNAVFYQISHVFNIALPETGPYRSPRCFQRTIPDRAADRTARPSAGNGQSTCAVQASSRYLQEIPMTRSTVRR